MHNSIEIESDKRIHFAAAYFNMQKWGHYDVTQQLFHFEDNTEPLVIGKLKSNNDVLTREQVKNKSVWETSFADSVLACFCHNLFHALCTLFHMFFFGVWFYFCSPFSSLCKFILKLKYLWSHLCRLFYVGTPIFANCKCREAHNR